MNAQVWQWAAEVVAIWLASGTPPRAAMAELPILRHATAAERAAVARSAAAAIAQRRRIEFQLAGARGLVELPRAAQALALVLATAVITDVLLADGAARQFVGSSTSRGHGAPAFGNLLLPFDAGTGDPVVAFGREYSVPDWFASRALALFGPRAVTVASALAAPAPRTLRTNTLRVATREALLAELRLQGMVANASAWAPLALQVEGDVDLFASAAYRRGAFEQQDEGSQLVALAVAPPPAGKVLDLCAGSGGKALALAAALGNRGMVMATDVHRGRLDQLRQRSARAGAHNIDVQAVDEHDVPPVVSTFAGHADRILVDAPCSGTGSWRRRPEARWQLRAEDLAALCDTQDRLLDRAARWLRPGARLVYATCSLLAEENEARIEALRTRHPELQPVRLVEVLGGSLARPIADASGTFLSLRPDQHGCDGLFAAILRRQGG